MDSTDAAQLWGDEAELGDTSTATQLPPPRAECPTCHLPALPFSTTFLPELLSPLSPTDMTHSCAAPLYLQA